VIDQVAYSGNIPLTHILNPGGVSGPLTLPLSQPLMFIRLKHVVGVPSPVDGQGFSISKLQILDALIDRLVRISGGDKAVEALKNPEKGKIDQAISAAKAQLDRELSLSAELPYRPTPAADGQLLNVSA